MNLFVPAHQFEIRFTNLINFPFIIREVLSPFVPLAKAIQIERENTLQARFTLTFDTYSVLVFWDRVVFRFEGDTSTLLENNSIVEEPFFNIFSKIKELKDFGTITNMLHYTVCMNIIEGKTKEVVVNDFSKMYLNESTKKIMSNPNDLGIILEDKIGSIGININFGPYTGIDDLKNRNITPVTDHIIENSAKFGEFAEIKLVETSKIANFKKYKELSTLSNDYLKKLWPQL